MYRKIGFIGSGNIGTSMIASLIKSGFTPPSCIYACDVSKEKLEQLSKDFGINKCANNTALVKEADVVIIAVKPQNVAEVLDEIKGSFADRMLITIAAGIPVRFFEEALGSSRRIFRVMPNLPLVVNEGISIISYGSEADNDDIEFCKALFRNFGIVEELDESLMSEVIALTSSSPAYVFMMIESMITSAVKLGLPVNTAARIVSQTVLGSAKLFLDDKRVQTGQGNEYIEADGCDGELLNEDRIRNALMKAMQACTEKALEFKKL